MSELSASIPILDPDFQSLARFHRERVSAAQKEEKPVVLKLALEREHGLVSIFESTLGPQGDPENRIHAERLVKFLLWSRGGYKLYVHSSPEIFQYLSDSYAPGGLRAFDALTMKKIYEKDFSVIQAGDGDLPASHELETSLGGNLDGCRIGFDLGASDYKVAAVSDGEVVFSNEYPWNPKDETDPEYHYSHVREGLRKAAEHLPKVDAIGGSSAGVIVDNRFMVASLLRSIPEDKLPRARDLFLRLQEEWNVPFEVANDGDVTALAGAMSLGVHSLLGIAMGSSEAAGYINRSGKMTGWINELAFGPVDRNPNAPPEEWSGDSGVGALYFSQQAVNKLLPAAGIDPPPGSSLPERLKLVQQRMEQGDSAAQKIYETIGCYLGHALPFYSLFYEIRHLLLLGRVTSGPGGPILIDTALRVLSDCYPDLAGRLKIHMPDEKSRRVGQAVAAASLPKITSRS